MTSKPTFSGLSASSPVYGLAGASLTSLPPFKVLRRLQKGLNVHLEHGGDGGVMGGVVSTGVSSTLAPQPDCH